MNMLTKLFRLIFAIILLAGCSGAPTAVVLPTVSKATPTAPEPIASATPVAVQGKLAELLKGGVQAAPLVLQSAINGTAGQAIDIRFDQPMDPAKTAGALQIHDAAGGSLTGSVSWPEPTLLRFTPNTALQPGAVYQVRLGTGATSARGVALKDSARLDLTTSGAVAVSQVFPARDAQSVTADSTLTVMFDRPVVELRIAEEQNSLPQPMRIDPPVEGQGQWINTSVYLFRPKGRLKSNTHYSITIPAGLAGATKDSLPLQEDYVWSFRTSPPAVDRLRIRLGDKQSTELDEASTVENVPLNPAFTLHFFQPMDREQTSAALSLQAKAGAPVAVTASWSNDGMLVNFAPTERLALGTTYVVHLAETAQTEDGSGLEKALEWQFRTVLPPNVRRTQPSNGSQAAHTVFEIDFDAPMNVKSVLDKIEFNPPLDFKENWNYDAYTFRLYVYGLKYSTQYQVRLLPGMADLYGNTTQVTTSIGFTTRPRDPQAWLMLPNMAQFRASTLGQENGGLFYTRLVNVPKVVYSLYRISTRTAIQYQSNGVNSQPAQSDLVWQRTYENEAGQDKTNFVKLPITGPDGKDLPKGFYLLTLDAPSIPHPGTAYLDSRMISVADTSVMLKLSSDKATAWVTDLDSGKPVQGLNVQVYDRFSNVIGQGPANADGLVQLDVPWRMNDYYPNYWAVIDDGQHLAVTDSNAGSGYSPNYYGIWEQYYTNPRPDIVYLFTERPIYRPGQPVYFKGILRNDDDLTYTLPQAHQVEVRISNFKGEVYRETLDVNEWGTFSGTFPLDLDAALGWYSMEVRYPNDANNSIGWLGFSVAEYRRPEFQLKLAADPNSVLAGEEFRANLKAEYYSGGGLSAADVDWTLRSEPFTYTPPDTFSAYSFSNIDWDSYYDIYMRRPGKTDNLLAQGKDKTDEQGSLTLTLPAKLKTGDSQTLILETNVTDFAGTTVSAHTSVIAHSSLVYPGVRFAGYLGTEGKPQTVELAALDWDGKPVAGQVVDVQIVERRWHSVQEQDERGNLHWKSSVEEIPVETFEAVRLGDDGKGSVTFSPPRGGIYKAIVSARDVKGNQAVASNTLWVTGKEFIPWRQSNDRGFQLVADRATYQPGDTAEIMIASPFQGQVYALVTVERGKVRKQEVIRLESNSTVYRLPITADMAPNVYFSVVVVKGVDDTSPRPDFRIGMTELKVTTNLQTLQVALQADPPAAGPGDTVTYTVTTSDLSGQPVEAEVSLGLSDLAALSLADPNSPPILKAFYDRRALGIRTAMGMINSIEDFNANLSEVDLSDGERAGSGGGKGEGEYGVMEIRQNFPDTAFWQADVRTDASGKATVTVKLPDNLTTWRMDARAVTLDTRVGQATLDLISSKPLLLRPQTPRFFVAGDRVTLRSAVHNNTQEALNVDVTLEGTGITINGESTQRVDIAAGQRALVRWDVLVGDQGQPVDLVFSAKSGPYQDASRPTIGLAGQNGLPVYRYEAPETVATSGQLTEQGALAEAIRLPESMAVKQGALTVNVSPSLTASLTDGLTYLEHYPYECIEQTISRFLPNVLVTRVLKEAGLSDPAMEENLKTQVNIALQRLASKQHEDGGWGWWGEQTGPSDEQVTAYALLGLLEANEAGYVVPADMLVRARMYLSDRAATLPDSSGLGPTERENRQAFVLYVLARSGHPQPALVDKVYEDRRKIDQFARALLLRAIVLQDAGDPRIATLRSDFASEAILSASGAHWEEKQADTWNWSSDTRSTAMVLGSLVMVDAKNPLVANTVRWLMSHRTDSRWASTQETAWTLMALADWIRISGDLKPDYEYAIQLNGQVLSQGKADLQTVRDTLTLRKDVTDLARDTANELIVARGDGTGNLYYTADLKVWLPVPQIQALDRGIILSREYYRLDEPETPVQSAQQGELLRARITIIAPNALHYVVVDDPLPAGLEGIDASLLTSPGGAQPEVYRWSDWAESGWGWWYFDHIEMRDERVVLSAGYLPAGTYTYTYLVRASTPGIFNVIPPTSQEFYFPEVYGRGAGMAFEVK